MIKISKHPKGVRCNRHFVETNQEWRSSKSAARTEIAYIDKLTQIQNIQETHAHTHTHTKPSAIKIIHIDNMAKHTEKHVGKLCCFESHICKLDRNHMYKSRIGNTLRISHIHTKVTLKNTDTTDLFLVFFSNRSFDTFFIQNINTKPLNENIEAAPGTPCFPGKCTSKTKGYPKQLFSWNKLWILWGGFEICEINCN